MEVHCLTLVMFDCMLFINQHNYDTRCACVCMYMYVYVCVCLVEVLSETNLTKFGFHPWLKLIVSFSLEKTICLVYGIHATTCAL